MDLLTTTMSSEQGNEMPQTLRGKYDAVSRITTGTTYYFWHQSYNPGKIALFEKSRIVLIITVNLIVTTYIHVNIRSITHADP